jgi:ATP-dependent Clp protease ATP-binding subunit ClpA
VLSELHRFLRPELVGRFDEKIVFKPLTPDTQRQIGLLTITEELERFRAQGFELSIADSAFEFLVRRGVHKAHGARPMKRVIQKLLGDALRDSLKYGAATSGVVELSPAEDRLMVAAPTNACSLSRSTDGKQSTEG